MKLFQDILRKLLHLAAFCLQPFTRVANKISWRFGRPYRCSRLHSGLIPVPLSPGMVLLSHKDYELTNLFIRGYWTHAAVVTEWNEVVEAVSAGVVRTGLEDFISRTDDLLILRPAFCGRQEMEDAAIEVQKFVGFPYNFRFNRSKTSVYCSELVCRAYEGTSWMQGNIDRKISVFSDFINGNILLPEGFAVSGEFVMKKIDFPE